MNAGLLTREICERHLRENTADLFAFGRPFISNPDLPDRFKYNQALVKPQFQTFYGDFMPRQA